MVDLSTYHSIYKTAKSVKTLLFIIFAAFFIYRSYELYIQHHQVIMDYLKINVKTNNAPLISYFWQQVELLKNYTIFIFVIWLIFYIYSNFPIKKQWIINWDNANEVNPILGRSISYHFRYNKSLNHKTLFKYAGLANLEQNMLQRHSQNKDLYTFLNKYDTDFSKDIQ